ncbi:MAG TPA: TetR/AcrR family transcriptional regulator [Vitreimonas sp.]|uniref:TetR/AcrR family transcriptional regulator n=1 Tax=Vitreimonas sp. TaxID=3069702 RepID=UPI002D2FA699|nr:TetR/AcrR family transcriptional regulator [Vitreimonas sp.]HYD89756.1 TetR/AcrR family transcriptional regulator [Vitreimonas sp.]
MIAAIGATAAQKRKEETRLRILETASRLFQERGVDGVGVDEIMRESGLTHGGFYAHFASKEALVEEACIRAIDAKLEDLQQFITALGDDAAFETYARRFLKGDPRTDSPTCPMAMLGPDIARREPIQKAYAQRIRRLIADLSKQLDCPKDDAMLVLSALVGATVLAAQTSSDSVLAKRIITAVREGLLECGSFE